MTDATLSSDAVRILEFIESPDVLVRLVVTHDRGEVAQVVRGTEGLYIAPASTVAELLTAGRIEPHDNRVAHYVFIDGVQVIVQPEDVIVDNKGEPVTTQQASKKIYQKKQTE
jgi:hypothetical protein